MDIQAIRTTHAVLEPLPTHPAIGQLVAHRDFHAAVYRARDNDLLIESLEGLWDKADRILRQTPDLDDRACPYRVVRRCNRAYLVAFSSPMPRRNATTVGFGSVHRQPAGDSLDPAGLVC
ncbi:FCD domain-containing protein [Mycobacterium sp.]|uniref:FCD domain-containing protein n=1 Tax=Mycobacterium sp. TaxID=1785 RepID=UPI002DA85E1E|nr:FCD domain-containing protein [Mycobacterium sp.]